MIASAGGSEGVEWGGFFVGVWLTGLVFVIDKGVVGFSIA